MPLVERNFTREEFMEKLAQNRGILLFKFGAEWCGPCKSIKTYLEEWGERLPAGVEFYEVDADESFELFAYLKTKKIIPGIPAILQYNRGTVSYVPDRVVIGAAKGPIDEFFQSI